MGVLDTAVDYRDRAYLDARSAALGPLARLDNALDAAREGGGERATTRHHARGKLLPRERIELLVDQDSPLLELGAVAGWGAGPAGPVGAAVVTALGTVEGRPCVIVADDPTQPRTAGTLRKIRRALQVALANQLPLVGLTDQAGTAGVAGVAGMAGQLDQVELFHLAGQVAAGFARLAGAGVPAVRACFGEPAAWDGPYEHAVALPGADEREALRLVRQWAGQLPPPPARSSPPPVPPKHDSEDLLAMPAYDPREILARVLDGSELDELRPGLDRGPCVGWGRVHGYPVAVLADRPDGWAGAEGMDQAVRLVRLAGRAGTPLLCLQPGLGHPDLAAVVASVDIPLMTVRTGVWQGVPALAALARFRFAWPAATAALAGSQPDLDPLELSGGLDDDGVIDPRDTRTVLGICLSVMP